MEMTGGFSVQNWSRFYHWTLLRRPLRADSPSIILCVFGRTIFGPQRRGSPHSGEGHFADSPPRTAEPWHTNKNALVEFQDIY